MSKPVPPPKKWISFTPWKAGTCFLAFALWIATLALLETILPGESEDAVTRQVNGGVEYTIRSLKSATLGIVFFVSFFGYPTLLFWLFRHRLLKEHCRVRGIPDHNSRGSLAGRIVGYVIVGILVAFILLVFVFLGIIHPLTQTHRITVRGDDVRMESLYRSWNISRRDIQQVDVTREVDDGRDGPNAEYQAIIRLKNGEQFHTASEMRRCPPDSPDDRRYENFFADLKAALTKKP